MKQTTIQRRRSPRFSFDTVQRIAPLMENERPLPSAFFPVRCRDISRGGFSFYVDERPEFQRLVAMVSSGKKCLYLVAEVVHIQELGPEADEAFLVGCRFTDRWTQ